MPRQRLRNRLIILLHRIGLPVGPTQLLTVAGRITGRLRTTPVAPVIVDGVPYIVQAYPGSDWVKNARAAPPDAFAIAASLCPLFRVAPGATHH